MAIQHLVKPQEDGVTFSLARGLPGREEHGCDGPSVEIVMVLDVRAAVCERRHRLDQMRSKHRWHRTRTRYRSERTCIQPLALRERQAHCDKVGHTKKTVGR